VFFFDHLPETADAPVWFDGQRLRAARAPYHALPRCAVAGQGWIGCALLFSASPRWWLHQLISVGLLGEMLRNVTFRAEDEYSIRGWNDTEEAE
jgi:hypothetical protein